jgi:hypothetical protein
MQIMEKQTLKNQFAYVIEYLSKIDQEMAS